MTLGPRTTVQLVHFGPNSRIISLDGEAYFEVTHVKGTPFLVRGEHVMTRVLGTAFLMRSVHGQRRAHIAVIDGKVAVKALPSNGQEVAVTAGYLSEVTDSTIRVTAAHDVAPGAEWVHDKLVFRNAPLGVVLQTLSRWYGYQFRCVDSTLLRREVTIGVSVRSSAAALAAIEQVLRVNVTAVGDTITLKAQPANPMNGAPRIHTYDVWVPIKEVGR
jgi:ferric-dicitrate binding protein FerR (iron transport regulator)